MATSRYEAGGRNRTGPDDASGPDASPKGVSRKRAVRHRVAAAAPRPGNGARPPAEAGSLPDVVELACRFARERGRPVLTYLLGAGDPAEDRPDVPITARTVEQVERALGDESFDDLDLVIHSSGGDVHAAYQMMCLLRGRMTGKGQLVAWVPRKALSSATLLCLGADEIRLGELGALGPLDAQIRRGTTDLGTPDYVSALHLLKSLNRLQQFALETFTETAAVLYDHQIGNEDVLRFGVEFSRAITAPLFARIDSEKAGFWDQMLQTGEFYGCRLLEKGRLVRPGDADTPREEQIKRIVHQVVFGFPSHELRLRADELSGPELQLNAFLVPAEQPRLRGLARGLSAASAQTLIALVRPLDGSLDDPLDGDVPGERARQPLPRTDWRTIGADDTALEFSWAPPGEPGYALRVGLYRPKVTPQNPWRRPVTRRADGGPATRYAAIDLL